MTAARRFREITADLTEAVERHRIGDRERAAELAVRQVELREWMLRAGEREALTRVAITLRWEAVLDALWAEQWMPLRPIPGPNSAAAGSDPDSCDQVVDARYEALLDLLRKRRLGASRRGSGSR